MQLQKWDEMKMSEWKHYSKFAPLSEGGGKACIVLSGSPLFTGDAGSGPSNIRRWLFKKDYIDCIVKLPQGEFFLISNLEYA